MQEQIPSLAHLVYNVLWTEPCLPPNSNVETQASNVTILGDRAFISYCPRTKFLCFLPTQHSETKIIASSPITSWQIDGETMETVTDLYFWAAESLQMVIAAMKIKRHLLLGKKVMTNLDSILKSRNITLSTKVCLVKAMVFPVVMYGCESWTVKKAECQRIDASELWCWRRLLQFPWTARSSNQTILKKIGPGISLEGMMLKLKLQCFGHLM